eukprot:6192550-Pleurochrysis_carterae.AAC.1
MHSNLGHARRHVWLQAAPHAHTPSPPPRLSLRPSSPVAPMLRCPSGPVTTVCACDRRDASAQRGGGRRDGTAPDAA